MHNALLNNQVIQQRLAEVAIHMPGSAVAAADEPTSTHRLAGRRMLSFSLSGAPSHRTARRLTPNAGRVSAFQLRAPGFDSTAQSHRASARRTAGRAAGTRVTDGSKECAAPAPCLRSSVIRECAGRGAKEANAVGRAPD